MTKQYGTLKELNVQPGDVVECVGTMGMENWTIGKHYDVKGCGTPEDDDGETYGCYLNPQPAVTFRIISRAPDDKPKRWRDMTDEERGALLLAEHEGKVIEVWQEDLMCFDEPFNSGLPFRSWHAYRIRPEPKRETVTITNFHENARGHSITFDTIDGKPDCDSVKMEEL